MKSKIAFLGTPRLAQIILESLANTPYKPQLVVTAPDTKSGRGQKPQMSPVKQTAITNNIRVLQPSRTLLDGVEKFDLAILVAYGKIIPKEILQIPKYGFLNVHPSLLPKYRGPSPIQGAILAGEEKTGVTIIKLDEQIDHGPILAQKEIKIEDTDTHESLIEKLGELGAGLLLEVLPSYLAHLRGVKSFHLGGVLKNAKIFLPPKPQNHSQATFTKRITKEDGKIDLKNPPDPQTLDRMIRAFYPWPTVWSKWKIRERIFDKSKRENGKWKIFKFLPATNYQLPFLIQPEGKRPMSISEFRNGYPEVFEQIKHLFSQKAQS